MSKNLKGLLNKMLNCDVSKRASAESVLLDPWLQWVLANNEDKF